MSNLKELKRIRDFHFQWIEDLEAEALAEGKMYNEREVDINKMIDLQGKAEGMRLVLIELELHINNLEKKWYSFLL